MQQHVAKSDVSKTESCQTTKKQEDLTAQIHVVWGPWTQLKLHLQEPELVKAHETDQISSA